MLIKFAVGKSYAVLADPVRDMGHPQFNGLIVRKTTEELRELITKSQELYPKVFPGAKWSERKMTWRMPTGGQLWMSFVERDADVSRYQGQAFNYIAFDELTQWATPYCWDYLRSRCRTTAPDLTCYMRATTNPGGIGHNWVKKMFIDPAPWGEPFWATDIETGEPMTSSKTGKYLFKRRFIPSKLEDNPYLADTPYGTMLESLPENQRKQLLEGDWDAVTGAAFGEWNRKIHTIEPFEIPQQWRRFRSCDYGYSSHSGVLWFAIDPDTDQIIVYRELYTKGVQAADLSRMVKRIEYENEERVSYGVLDSSVWDQRGDRGPSMAEQMIRAGVAWRPSDRSKGSRVAGKNELHRLLQVDEFTGEPRIVFFNTCVNTIAQLPVLPLDTNNVEDVDTKAEDHLYDALRYGIMTRPKSGLSEWVFAKKTKPHRPADPVLGY